MTRWRSRGSWRSFCYQARTLFADNWQNVQVAFSTCDGLPGFWQGLKYIDQQVTMMHFIDDEAAFSVAAGGALAAGC
jgi:hypothetical protein